MERRCPLPAPAGTRRCVHAERSRSWRSKKRDGVSDEVLIATITHMAFYAGWPKAMSALTVARGVLAS
jgi:alkylhydroperoxidase/carboxymuconolactone decarboxylase family protein YurZ